MENSFRVRFYWGSSRPGDTETCVEISGGTEYVLSADGSKSTYFATPAVPEGIHLPFSIQDVSDKIYASRGLGGELKVLREVKQ